MYWITDEVLSRAHGVSAAVHRQRDPRTEGGLVRGQKGDGLRHLLGGAGAAQRMRGARALQKGRVGRLVHAAALVNVRDDDAGVDRVDTDMLGSQLQCHATSHLSGNSVVCLFCALQNSDFTSWKQCCGSEMFIPDQGSDFSYSGYLINLWETRKEKAWTLKNVQRLEIP